MAVKGEEELGELAGLVEQAPDDQKLEVLKRYLGGVDDPHTRAVIEQAYLIGVRVGRARRHAIALIHGIRTHAAWQDVLAAELRKSPDVTVYPIGYGFFDVVRFWLPLLRAGPIKRVLRELRGIRAKHMGDDISIVAHSFGTYIVGRILQKKPDVVLHRLLLCGCVLQEGFAWDMVPQRPRDQVINEVGTRDIWPVMAKVSSWGYGCSGTFGFKTHALTDRYHDLDHSGFFAVEHMSKFWVPFLVQGVVVPSRWDVERPTPPWLLSTLSWFPVKSALLLATLYVIFF